MTLFKYKDIDEYIAGFPEETQRILQQIRITIRNAAPGIKEKISYKMPTFTLGGRYLVYLAAHKKHISIYPVRIWNKEFEKDFSSYKTSGKGTIQFPLDKPMPLNLITKIVKYRVKENSEKSGKKNG